MAASRLGSEGSFRGDERVFQKMEYGPNALLVELGYAVEGGALAVAGALRAADDGQ